MRDLFDWAEERASTVVIRAEQLFHKRREAVVTRLLFGPPMPDHDGVVLGFNSSGDVRSAPLRRHQESTRLPQMTDNPWLRPAGLRRLTADAEAKAAEMFPDDPVAREEFVGAYIAGVIEERDRWNAVLRHALASGRELTATSLLEFDLPADVVLAALEAGVPDTDGSRN